MATRWRWPPDSCFGCESNSFVLSLQIVRWALLIVLLIFSRTTRHRSRNLMFFFDRSWWGRAHTIGEHHGNTAKSGWCNVSCLTHWISSFPSVNVFKACRSSAAAWICHNQMGLQKTTNSAVFRSKNRRHEIVSDIMEPYWSTFG